MPTTASLASCPRNKDSQDDNAAVAPAIQPSGDRNAYFDGSRHVASAELRRLMSFEPAPIEMGAFGKRLGEIVSKAMLASPQRRKR
jgi:hypothetical protein